MSDQELRERRYRARQDKTSEGFEPSPAAWRNYKRGDSEMKIIEIPIKAQWRWLQCECGCTDIGEREIAEGGWLYWCKRCHTQYKSDLHYPHMCGIVQLDSSKEVQESDPN